MAENPDYAAALQGSALGLELLVICGVYADALSIVAPTAFRVLESLIYGDELLGIDPGGTANIWEMVEKYADDLRFEKNPTSQMVAALPLLWRHKSKKAKQGQYPVVKVEYETADGPSGEFWVYERRHRHTPMKVYGRLLLDEPPMQSAPNLGMLKAWKAYDQERNGVRQAIPPDGCSWEELKTYQAKVFEMDVTA
jgi:hypothetical protein